MLGVRLDDKLDKKLTRIAKEDKRPKSFSARQALEMYLDDITDFEEALKRHNCAMIESTKAIKTRTFYKQRARTNAVFSRCGGD